MKDDKHRLFPIGKIPWDRIPFGKTQDIHIATVLGCTRERVRQEREKRGIAKFGSIDWDKVDFSKSDAVLIEELGASHNKIRTERFARGIFRESGLKSMDVDWANIGLGTQMDKCFAKELGCSVNLVSNKRTRLGIPSFRSQMRQAWSEKIAAADLDSILQGKMTVAEMGEEIGVPGYIVYRAIKDNKDWKARHSYPDIDWEKVEFSIISDRALAKELGCSHSKVSKERKLRGIQSHRSRMRGEPRPERVGKIICEDWDQMGLMTRPDREIANELKCSISTVCVARLNRGLTSHSKWLQKQKDKEKSRGEAVSG